MLHQHLYPAMTVKVHGKHCHTESENKCTSDQGFVDAQTRVDLIGTINNTRAAAIDRDTGCGLKVTGRKRYQRHAGDRIFTTPSGGPKRSNKHVAHTIAMQ